MDTLVKRFAVGDKVRRAPVNNSNKERTGTVVKVRPKPADYEATYDVKWDDKDEPSRGYFWWGLRKR